MDELLNDEGDFDALLDAFKRDPDAPRPEWALDPNRDLMEQLNETPFFMSQLPANAQDNVKLQALQALLYEGTPEDVALNFKEKGNEAFKRGSAGYADALKLYTNGIDQRCSDSLLNAQLYNNRCAVNMALKNFGDAARDAVTSISLDNENVKAYFRAARSYLALKKLSEAEEYCQKGIQLFPDNTELVSVRTEINSARFEAVEEKKRLEAGKIETMKLRKEMLNRGVKYQVDAEKRSILELGPGMFGSNPPRVTFSNSKTLAFPLVFMYPPLGQFDFVQAATDDTTLYDHLVEMFAQPAPWDPEVMYKSVATMSAYILPVDDDTLDESSKKPTKIYRVSLRTPINRLLGSVIKYFELGLLSFYILPNRDERKRFEAKFEGYKFLDI